MARAKVAPFAPHEEAASNLILHEISTTDIGPECGYLSVSSVERARRAVSQAGGKVLSEPMKFPKRGEQAVFANPEGALFGIVTTRTMAAQTHPPVDHHRGSSARTRQTRRGGRDRQEGGERPGPKSQALRTGVPSHHENTGD